MAGKSKSSAKAKAVSEKTIVQEDGDSATKDRPDMVRKTELIDAIVLRTGLKKKDVKPTVEATLELFAQTLKEGKDLSLPPMGKIKLMKSKDLDNGAKVLTLKLRLARPSEALEDLV